MPESTNTKKAAAAIALLILSVALRPPIVSIGPVLDSIQRSFSLSYTQASLLIAIPDICMGVFALVAPGVARRFGTDNAVVAALVLLCVAMIARALAGSGRENIVDGPTESAALAQPSGLSLDGNFLYFADSEVSAVRRIDLAAEQVHTLIGKGLFDFGDVDGPVAKAIDDRLWCGSLPWK